MPPASVKITVVGTGYVGISNAVLLAQRNRVVALDIDARKVAMINAKTSPIADPEIEAYLATRPLDLVATAKPEHYAAAAKAMVESGLYDAFVVVVVPPTVRSFVTSA